MYSRRVVGGRVVKLGGRVVDEWQLFWVGAEPVSEPIAVGGLEGWSDLAERERALGFRQNQPILMDPSGRVDARISEIFRHGDFARKALTTKETYALSCRLFLTFLSRRSARWDQATSNDVDDWEDWRLRGQGNPSPIGGAAWARELAALKLFYKIAVKRGFVTASPVLTHTVTGPGGEAIEVADNAPTDVRRSNVKWLTPRAFRLWRDVGLGGRLPSGLDDSRWPGRNDGRDTAFADFVYSCGLRRREAGTLLVAELPATEKRSYYAGWVGRGAAKGSGRFYYVSHAALQSVELYRSSTRRAAVRRAQARGLYERVPRQLLLREVTGQRTVRWSEPDGRTLSAHIDRLSVEQRMRMFVLSDGGVEPAMLWLTESGMPMAHTSWSKVFDRADERCKAAGLSVFATPHMLRHSMALRMLVSLHFALDRRLGLTPQQRERYESAYGTVWIMVKDLLGHRSEITTKEIYLEPVRGLQIESLLEDRDNPDNRTLFSELARRTGLIIDAP